MSKQVKTMTMYDGKVFSVKPSKYALKAGYLDYLTLSKIVGESVRNCYIYDYVGSMYWTMVNGYDKDDVEEIFQHYIITEEGYKILRDYTDEIVYYCEELEMYLWGITHFGTGWDMVLTDVKLVGDGVDNE